MDAEETIDLEVVVIASTGSEMDNTIVSVGPQGVVISKVCHGLLANGWPRKRYYCCGKEFLRSQRIDQALLREYRDMHGGARPILRIENILG